MIKTISKGKKELMDFMTQKDCTDLKKLIVENPEAPLLIFAGEEAWSGDYGYESVDAGFASLKEITIYGNQWLDRDDFEDVLRADMANDEQYENLSDEEFDAEVAKIVAETAFVKAIVIYVG